MLSVADENCALSVDVAPGQVHDAVLLERTLDAATARVVVDEVVADKAYAGTPQREACIDRNLAPQVPNKCNSVDPWPFDPTAYRERNKVERLINKLKQFRRVATRYDKLRITFLGMLHLTLGFVQARAIINTA
jgi:transposase